MGTKEYHAQKSKEWYHRTKESNPEYILERRQYTAQRRREAKSYWVKHFGSVCAHCSGTFPDCVFEFHHINHDEKELEPSHMFHLKKSVAEEELKKCIMLCANCHRIEHEKLKYDAHTKRT